MVKWPLDGKMAIHSIKYEKISSSPISNGFANCALSQRLPLATSAPPTKALQRSATISLVYYVHSLFYKVSSKPNGDHEIRLPGCQLYRDVIQKVNYIDKAYQGFILDIFANNFLAHFWIFENKIDGKYLCMRGVNIFH